MNIRFLPSRFKVMDHPYQVLGEIVGLRSVRSASRLISIGMDLLYDASGKEPMATHNHFVNGRKLSELLDRTLLVLSPATAAILFGWVLYYSNYGLNPSDEGFWLNSMANPFAYLIRIPPNFYDFIYHWPYQWAGGDIAVLRMVNVTLTMTLGWIVSFLTVRRLWMMGWPHAGGAIGRDRQPFISRLLLEGADPQLLYAKHSIGVDSDDQSSASPSARAHAPGLRDYTGRRWRLAFLHG